MLDDVWVSRRSKAVVSGSSLSAMGAAANRSASAALISRWRVRKARSSNRLRRSQPVTSSLHLLALQELQAGAMLSSV